MFYISIFYNILYDLLTFFMLRLIVIEDFNDELNKGVASYDRYMYTEK